MIKISITVPVYNTSFFLKQCLDSLLNQSLMNIEFIIVDDGSTDSSGLICDEYAKKDPRFKVIHKENGGLASARQIGLENAKGDYIIVCDSDDWVEPDMYEKLYKKAIETDADIVTCGYFAEYSDGRSVPIQYKFKENNGIIDNMDFLINGAGSSWIKLIKKSLFKKANVNYEMGINLGEDVLIIYKLLKTNPKIVQIDGNLYHYRRLFGQNTYTNSINKGHIDQLIFIFEWLKNNYSTSEYESLRYRKALDLAFAFYRLNEKNKTPVISNFLKKELPFKLFFKNKLTKKSFFILISKIFPYPLSKYFVKQLYPFFYK